MRSSCWLVISLLFVFALPTTVEGRAVAASDGDADDGDSSADMLANAADAAASAVDVAGLEEESEAAGSKKGTEDAEEEEQGEEADDEEGAEDEDHDGAAAGGTEADEGEDDGEDTDEEDSSASFVQEADEDEDVDEDDVDDVEQIRLDNEEETPEVFMKDTDSNHDGKLSLEELHSVVDEDVEDTHQELTTQGDQQSLTVFKEEIAKEKQSLTAMFVKADVDKDSFVNATELPLLLKAMDEDEAQELATKASQTDSEKDSADGKGV